MRFDVAQESTSSRADWASARPRFRATPNVAPPWSRDETSDRHPLVAVWAGTTWTNTFAKPLAIWATLLTEIARVALRAPVDGGQLRDSHWDHRRAPGHGCCCRTRATADRVLEQVGGDVAHAVEKVMNRRSQAMSTGPGVSPSAVSAGSQTAPTSSMKRPSRSARPRSCACRVRQGRAYPGTEPAPNRAAPRRPAARLRRPP